MMSENDPPDLNAIIPADSIKSLSLPAEMVNRGLVLATKLELKRNIKNYQTPLKQCQGSYTLACVSFSKNGLSALITGYGKRASNPSIVVWNASDESRIIALLSDQDSGFVDSAALSKNAEVALIGYSDGHVVGWDIRSHAARYFPADTNEPLPPDHLMFSFKMNPGQSFQAQSDSVNTKNSTPNQPDRSVTAIAFSPDERYFAECSGHSQIRIRDIQSGKEIICFPVGYLDYYSQIAFSEDGSKLVVARGRPTTSKGGMLSLITIFDLTGKREALMLGGDRIIDATAVAFFPGSQKVLSLEAGGGISVWNALDGTEISHWSHVKSRDDANDLVSRKEVSTHMVMEFRNPMIWGLSSVAVSPDGKRILSGGGDTFMRLWSLDGHRIYEYPHNTRVVRVAFTPDGRQALSGCWDGSAYLWELPQ
jgi:WD40 repeat protein